MISLAYLCVQILSNKTHLCNTQQRLSCHVGSTLIAGYKEIKEGDEVFSLTMLLASKELVPQTQVGTLEMHLFSKYFALTPHTSRKHALFLHKLKQKEADANDGSPAAQLFVRLTNQYGLRNPLGETESTNAN